MLVLQLKCLYSSIYIVTLALQYVKPCYTRGTSGKIMKMTVNNRFAVLLAEKRIKERRNISLQEVSKKTGVSRRALYAWENNRVNRFDVPVIDALCEYFGINPGELFHYIPNEKPKATPRKVKKPA